jgi:hypothetical protein
MELAALPGGALVAEGLSDLVAGRETEAALLVRIGRPRLKRLGLPVPEEEHPFVEHELYLRLAKFDPNSAHSRYNSLLRLLVSFERAAECGA